MNILVTGAFGGIGVEVLRSGYAKGHHMSAFDLDNKTNRKKAAGLRKHVRNTFWGDLRNQQDVRQAVQNQDAVIHLGAIVTPFSEHNPMLSDAVNIGGTQNLIHAIEQLTPAPGLVFTSSMSIMGADKNRKPPLKVNDPTFVSSNYTRQKIECESLLKQTDIPWVITRLGAVINTELSIGGGSLNLILGEVFSMSLDNRIEGIWNIDAATALISAAEKLAARNAEVNHQTFFLGGGQRLGWQLTVRELYKGVFGAIGFGLPAESAFGTNPYYADWLDTEKSQELLQYQNHSFEEFLQATKKKLGIKHYVMRFYSPMIKLIMGHMARHYH